MEREENIWELRLLRRLEARRGEKVVTHFVTRKAAALLALLALEPHWHRRDALARRLWDKDTPATTRQNLRRALADLRAALLFALADTPTRTVVAFQMARRLHWLWYVGGHSAETASYGYEGRFLAREEELAEEDRWLALLVHGQRAWRSGRRAEAETLLTEAHRSARGPARWRDVPPGHVLARVRNEQGRLEEAVELLEGLASEAEAAAEFDQASWLLADLAMLLGQAGDEERWEAVAERARTMDNRALEAPPDAPSPVWDSQRARREAQAGRWAEAEARMRAAANGFAAAGWRLWEAGLLYELGFYVERQGREPEAVALYRRSLALFDELNETGELQDARRRVAMLAG